MSIWKSIKRKFNREVFTLAYDLDVNTYNEILVFKRSPIITLKTILDLYPIGDGVNKLIKKFKVEEVLDIPITISSETWLPLLPNHNKTLSLDYYLHLQTNVVGMIILNPFKIIADTIHLVTHAHTLKSIGEDITSGNLTSLITKERDMSTKLKKKVCLLLWTHIFTIYHESIKDGRVRRFLGITVNMCDPLYVKDIVSSLGKNSTEIYIPGLIYSSIVDNKIERDIELFREAFSETN